METFAGYGFNKAHSASYAINAYQTAYLKTHYPAEFMAAQLSSIMNDKDKVAAYVQECRRMGIETLPPDVNAQRALLQRGGGEDPLRADRDQARQQRGGRAAHRRARRRTGPSGTSTSCAAGSSPAR